MAASRGSKIDRQMMALYPSLQFKIGNFYTNGYFPTQPAFVFGNQLNARFLDENLIVSQANFSQDRWIPGLQRFYLQVYR